MTVHSADGQKLGKIVRVDAGGIIIEKGIFFIKDYLARHEDVATVDGDDVRLVINKEQLRRLDDESATLSATDAGAGAAGVARPERDRVAGGEELRVPVVEEELAANKVVRQAGEVVVRKEVHTEHRTVDVPVVREEVHVERRPVDQPAGADVAAFQDETVRVPIREEDVEITKRPVVREEVRVSRTPHVEHRAADATVRREEVDVDDSRRTRRDDDDDTRR
jgi:uncharacterized protein (TIGR02271 family)